MNLRENFEKLKCAKLQEKKAFLEAEYNKLIKIYEEMINEDGEQPPPPTPRLLPVPSTGQQQKDGQQYSMQSRVAGKKKRIIGDEGQAKSEDQVDTKEPFQLAQGQQGFALTPDWAQAQQDVLTRYFDKPETAEKEVAGEASWQNLNQAVSNFTSSQVSDLLKKQRMMG